MNDTLKLIETRTINDALVNGYYGKKEAWFTRDEIGSVLGYADPRQSIANIHNRHKERFSDKSVQINLICTDGKSYDTTVYNFKGVMEICRWSKQPKADMVMEALYDMTVKEIVYLLSTKQGLTQDDLANKIGYTNQGSVARPLSRNSGMTMRVDTLIRWLEALDAQIVIEPLDGDDGYVLDGEKEL